MTALARPSEFGGIVPVVTGGTIVAKVPGSVVGWDRCRDGGRGGSMFPKVGLACLQEHLTMRRIHTGRLSAGCHRDRRSDGMSGIPPIATTCASRVLFGVLVAATAWPSIGVAQSAPYNPYADSQDSRPPLAADGTLHWGTFYKSAELQQAYQRLWNLGACRGTNKAITVPVENNRLAVDGLPETTLTGVVRGVQGRIGGGMIAFVDPTVEDPSLAVRVAVLHPAGVSRLSIRGDADATVLRTGLTVRCRATVDRQGKAIGPVETIDIVTPPVGFRPDAIRPDTPGTIIGTVTRVTAESVNLRVDAGSIRRVVIPLTAGLRVSVDCAELDLASAGDTVEIKGRLWTGTGCLAGGTVFASDVTIVKPERLGTVGVARSP